MNKPNVNSKSEMELEKVGKQLDDFSSQIEDMTLDRMNKAPKLDVESQTKMSQQEIANSKDVYLKPHTIVGCRDKFNEAYRDQYNFDKEYVYFQAENKEIIGEVIELWTRPYGGMPAEFWKVPVNKPVWGPRYLAEQIKRCYYHRLIMSMKPNNVYASDSMGEYAGTMAVDTTVQRLDAVPVTKNRSIFMGSKTF